MSILFFDHLIVLNNLNKKLKKDVSTSDEMQELWQYIEEIIHHKVIGCCLENLPLEHHSEFLDMFHKRPYDKEIIKYLNLKSGKDIEKIIKGEIKKLSKEILVYK